MTTDEGADRRAARPAADEGETADGVARFAGLVSHDLKNPLAAVRMSLELAQEELGDDGDPEVRALLGRAERGVERMDVMINELRAFAHVGAEADRTPVDLGALAEEVLTELGEAVGPGQVRGGHTLPTVTGDAGLLHELLRHLLDNAVRFSSWDASVDLAAERTPAGWRVTVADRGPGVPEVERERVFEPLVRLDRTVPGSGMGLATCYRIVTAHGGRIGLEDRAGGGALVWFELPA